MQSPREPGPDPDEVTDWILSTHTDTVIGESMGAIFYSLDESNWPNFATIVTTDEHDSGHPSDLDREGVYRLNIGVGKETFDRLVGSISEPDYAALDTIIPHPTYARQRWLSVLNPSRRTFEDLVKPLIAEAYERLAGPKRSRT